jgi:hypothetical protein
MSSQYYLSLGAGVHQLPLIEAAKKLGLKVIGVDQNSEAPGMPICDLKIQESIFNYRKICYKINSMLLDGEIVGGYSASFGKALLSWSYLAEKLKLGGISRPMMERLLDKYEVRKMLSDVPKRFPDFRQPKFMAARSGILKKHLEEFTAPFIVKPRSGWGKRNITEVADSSRFRNLFGKKNLIEKGILPSSFIIEEKIEGDEITVTGFVQNFRFIPVCITDKITSTEAPFIELEHRYPSKHYSLSSQITLMHQEIVQTLQITDTPIVSEWKIRDDKLYLIEISAQIPGEFLAGFLIPRALSYAFYENLVKLTLGRNVDRPPGESKTKPAIIKYFPEKISKEDRLRIEKNAEFFSILNENSKVPPEGNHDRYAVAGYTG